jgi:stage II sporulation protein D
MSKRIFLSIFVIILFLFGTVGENYASDKRLATGIEKIRVLLFDQNPTKEILVFGYNGPVTIKADGFSVTLVPGDVGAKLSLQGQNIVYERSGVRHQSQNWSIAANDTSLIRLLHQQGGWRYYKGSMNLTVEDRNKIRIINTVGLEDYVASVVGSEMNFENYEALKVQAVISRTYALWNISLYHKNDYELNDHVLNQVYKGEMVFKPIYRKAAEATSGEVLMWSNKLIMAVYHSTCGGQTTSNDSAWIGKPLAYLIGVNDNGACAASPHRDWEFEASKREVHDLLRPEGFGQIFAIDVHQKDPYDRVTSMNILGRNRVHEMSVNNFRLAINRHFGPLTLKSSYFTMEILEDRYIFRGHGLGHGVGLCQWGALGLAESGWNYQNILRFYYSGVEIADYSKLQGNDFFLARH